MALSSQKTPVAGLASWLKDRRDRIVKTVRTNVRRERTGYSDYTWWMTTVSFDEIEVVDFDALMAEIEEFEQEFKNRARVGKS